MRNFFIVLLIIIGFALLGFALVKGVSELASLASESQALPTEGAEGGFIPLLAPPKAEDELPAPTLESEVAQNPAAPAKASPTQSGPPLVPDRLVIPAIELDVPIIPVDYFVVTVEGKDYHQWPAPNERAVGWHETSATLGVPGNTVLNGHHNVHGEVFRYLVDLEPGDLVYVYSGEQVFTYRVAVKEILPERYESLEVRLENARWIAPSSDERITMVTCWPYTNYTHRLVVVALPAG